MIRINYDSLVRQNRIYRQAMAAMDAELAAMRSELRQYAQLVDDLDDQIELMKRKREEEIKLVKIRRRKRGIWYIIALGIGFAMGIGLR